MSRPLTRAERRCEHDSVIYCPLYHESYFVRPGRKRSLGCVHDMARPCRVIRGTMNYARAIAALAKVDHLAVWPLYMREREAQRTGQCQP